MLYTEKNLQLKNALFAERRFYSIKLALITAMLFLQACASIQQQASIGDLNAVQSYVEGGGDVNFHEYTSAGYACSLVNCAIAGGHEQVVRYLLDQGADVNKAYEISEGNLVYETGTPLERAIKTGNLNMVRLLIERKADVNLKAASGLAPLTSLVQMSRAFGWARSEPIAEELINAGANINSRDLQGKSALHYAASLEIVDGVSWLLSHGADTSLEAHHSHNGKGMRAIDIARKTENEKTIALLSRSESDHLDWENAINANTLAMYQLYLERHPTGLYVEKATTKAKALKVELELAVKARQKEMLAMKRKQPCSLNDDNWIYLKGSCRGNKANGQGEAVTMDGLKFVGRFENGYRVKGEIFHNDALMFDGLIKQGKPHGKAVCIHEGRPESCEYYKGKRIDGVFIQRLDFAHQQTLLTEQQRKIEERLAQNEQKMDQMASSLNSSRDRQAQAASGSRNGVSDMLVDKATDEAMQAIFNHLF